MEAAKAVRYGGLSEVEALKLVTINPAKQLRVDQQAGSLEVGKDADFVIWSRSPLDALTVAEETWIDGKKYFDRSAAEEQARDLREEREELIAKAKEAAGLLKPNDGLKAAQAAFFLLPWELQYEQSGRHCDSH